MTFPCPACGKSTTMLCQRCEDAPHCTHCADEDLHHSYIQEVRE